jgi:acyl-coenzyme A synthetase/AMP-(fatty) acid ligase
VLDAVVRGEPNAITGQVVAASVRLEREEPLAQFKARMRLFCRDRLEPYKVPTRVSLTTEPLHSTRYKRMRRGEPEQ